MSYLARCRAWEFHRCVPRKKLTVIKDIHDPHVAHLPCQVLRLSFYMPHTGHKYVRYPLVDESPRAGPPPITCAACDLKSIQSRCIVPPPQTLSLRCEPRCAAGVR